MRILGIAVSLKKTQSVARLVLLEATSPFAVDAMQNIAIHEQIEVKWNEVDKAIHVGEVFKSVRSQVTALQPDRVVVRRADRPARPSNQDGPRLRLLLEGGIVAACYDVVRDTAIRTGQDCGRVLGRSKAELEALVKQHADPAFVESSSAALSGLGNA